MKEAEVRKELSEIHTILRIAPAGEVATATAESEGLYQPEPAEDISMAESLEHLRLKVRYLVFDLEATRRENRYLRQMLESKRRGLDEGDAT